MMRRPLVSIVIPGYKADFLSETIESARAQTYANTELLISDNCPTGDVQRLALTYSQVRYHRNPITGIYSNFRSCIRLARGEFVKFLLDDDVLEPNCVEEMIEGFDTYPAASLVAGWYRVIDEGGRELEVRRLGSDQTIVSSSGGAAAPMLISARNPIGPLTTCMFRRRAFPLGMGPWFFQSEAPTRYFGLIDMAIILDLAFRGPVVLLNRVLSSMRSHSGQLSNPGRNPQAMRSITSWLPLAEDAHAFGLISAEQLVDAMTSIHAQYGRFTRVFPALARDSDELQRRLSSLRAATARRLS